jgi:cytochrome c oxidase assembly protein subunit 20
MPGGTAHTAGGKPAGDENLTYFQVVKNLGPEYYLNYHKRPCVRDSQLTGIASGFVGGSLAAITGRMLYLTFFGTEFEVVDIFGDLDIC